MPQAQQHAAFPRREVFEKLHSAFNVRGVDRDRKQARAALTQHIGAVRSLAARQGNDFVIRNVLRRPQPRSHCGRPTHAAQSTSTAVCWGSGAHLVAHILGLVYEGSGIEELFIV